MVEPAIRVWAEIRLGPELNRIRHVLDRHIFIQPAYTILNRLGVSVENKSRNILTGHMAAGRHTYTGQLESSFYVKFPRHYQFQPRDVAGRFVKGLPVIRQPILEIGFTRADQLAPTRGRPLFAYLTPFERGSQAATAQGDGLSFRRIFSWVEAKGIAPAHAQYPGEMRTGRIVGYGYTPERGGYAMRAEAQRRIRRASPAIAAFFIWRSIMGRRREGTQVISRTVADINKLVTASIDYLIKRAATVMKKKGMA